MTAPIRSLILRAARPYVAGETLDEALLLARAAAARDLPVTLGYWHDEAETGEAVAQAYLTSLEAAQGLDVRLAMKVPGLRADMDLVQAVFAAAKAQSVTVDIDAHAPEEADDAFRAAAQGDADRIGIAIPGRWTDGPKLADRAIEMGLAVRVVKGIWPDPDQPDHDPAQGYLAVIDRLAGRARAVAVATHDAPLAAEAIKRLQAAGTRVLPELLYGLPMEPPARVVANAGLTPRIYLPYGHAWVPYSMRQAIRRPSTFARFARDLARGKRDGLPPTG